MHFINLKKTIHKALTNDTENLLNWNNENWENGLRYAEFSLMPEGEPIVKVFFAFSDEEEAASDGDDGALDFDLAHVAYCEEVYPAGKRIDDSFNIVAKTSVMNIIRDPRSDDRAFDIVVWSDEALSKKTMAMIMAQLEANDMLLDDETVEERFEAIMSSPHTVWESYDMDDSADRTAYHDSLKSSRWLGWSDSQSFDSLTDQILKNAPEAPAHWWE